MIFVDTSAWFAVYSRRDINHAAAISTIRSFREPLVTTDSVVDETLILLQARGEHRRSIAFGRRIIEGTSAKVVRVDDANFANAWAIFKS
jgi:predicted nucleic acid-binding protein